MSLPDFLIIGAMKAGTTSLYHDLRLNSSIFMPSDKEPGNLGFEKVLTDEGLNEYSKLFEKAKPGQICGEASTAYSKLPDITGVPERALQLLGKNLKVIYLVREPIARIISQHQHELITRKVACEIEEAIQKYPRFINYSKYAMQITPWTDALGMEQVLVIGFESYIANRTETLKRVSRFLAIEAQLDAINPEIIHNRTKGKPMPVGPLAVFRQSGLYRRLVRPFLSTKARDILRKKVLPRASINTSQPSAKTLHYLVNKIGPDAELLKKIMGADRPNWACANLGRYDLKPNSQESKDQQCRTSGTSKALGKNQTEIK